MKPFRPLIAAALVVSLIGMSCGKSSTSSSTTFPTGGANGTNAAVTAANAGTVFASFLTEFASIQGSGLSGLIKPVASKPTKDVTVNGSNSGTATFSGSFSQTNGYTATVKFNNFSNDGQLFYQGSIAWKFKVTGTSFTGSYDGTINIQGTYKASMVYDLDFTQTSATGTIKITSDGNTFTYSL